MNHVFKIIWNKVNQCWVAVSELSKSAGKSAQTDKRKALNVIIGAAVLAGATTSAMAETNVVVNDQHTVVGGTDVSMDIANAVVLGTNAKVENGGSGPLNNIAIGNEAYTSNRQTIAIGDKAKGWGSGGVAIGSGSNAPSRVRQLVMVQKQVMRDGLQLSVMKQMQVVEVQRLWVMVPHHQERIQLLSVT